MEKESQDEHTLIDWFDDTMDEFHTWIGDIKDRREEYIKQREQEDVAILSKEINDVLDKEKKSNSIDKSSMWSFWIIG